MTAVDRYEREAAALAACYEARRFEELHGSFIDLLPRSPARVLDIGAGSGRDAAWLRNRGDVVTAVEPAAAMRAEALQRGRGVGIEWIDDRLPGLSRLAGREGEFDLLLLSGVWGHVRYAEREGAFARLLALAAPDGRLLLSFRHETAGEGADPVSFGEIEALAASRRCHLLRVASPPDLLGRPEVAWIAVLLTTGARQ